MASTAGIAKNLHAEHAGAGVVARRVRPVAQPAAPDAALSEHGLTAGFPVFNPVTKPVIGGDIFCI